MKISEKQLQSLLGYLIPFISCNDLVFTPEGKKSLCDLVMTIVNQQSQELKELDDEIVKRNSCIHGIVGNCLEYIREVQKQNVITPA